MKNVCFVCLGNICRSPMAEFIFKNKLRSAGIDDVSVCSRATSYEEEGNPVYPPARAVLLKHGIRCDGKFAARLEKSDYDKFDLIVCMEERNAYNATRIFGGDPDKKIKKLLDYTEEKGDIADPYYTGDFDLTYRQIDAGCEALCDLFITKHKL